MIDDRSYVNLYGYCIVTGMRIRPDRFQNDADRRNDSVRSRFLETGMKKLIPWRGLNEQ